MGTARKLIDVSNSMLIKIICTCVAGDLVGKMAGGYHDRREWEGKKAPQGVAGLGRPATEMLNCRKKT